MPKQFSVVTIAVGKTYYLNLAKNLLLSFLKWNSNNEIEFLLVTDNSDFFNEFCNIKKVEIKNIEVLDEDKSFTSKFLLYNHVAATENLFIDCDCIIYSDLTSVFKKFEKEDFSVIGRKLQTGNFFCDIEQLLVKLNLSYFPKFVGSVYYFKNNEMAKAIFEMAINLKAKYDELGFIRLRGKENEEPLFAAAMANFNQQPIDDDGSIKADAMFFTNFKCNVITGTAILENKNLSDNGYQSPKISKPAIVHYNDRYTELANYLADQVRLRSHLPQLLNSIFIQVKYLIPSFFTTELKNMFRPLYHQLLGPSKIKKIRRVD
ncbi:hypothetical protein [Pedobacter mucosus]|uniref:hypothetical protein n=1 Tax=Pedobacter mucosus TaxID=2895286 RepID=UPI001EE3E28D|nr:hypothetical protein [Pedobacter mucosus]UKT64389.1 hypothetical protein LOK61_01115 [Pedobacter mucosus]